MKLGVGVLFVAIGLVLLWAAVTGRLSRLPAAWDALKGDASDLKSGTPPTALPGASSGRFDWHWPKLPVIPQFSQN